MLILRARLALFVQQQAANRVFWLVLTGLTAALIGFVERQFNGGDLHSLAGQYVDTGVNPTILIRDWPAERSWLAWLDLTVDTLLFLPAYTLTLAIWCRYFSYHSLFVTNRFRPLLKLVMQCAGRWIRRLLVVAALADLLENVTMMGWLLAYPGPLAGGAILLLRLLKFIPAGAAVFFILLHPLGIMLSIREAFFRLIGIDRYNQADVRHRLMHHINRRRQTDLDIRNAVLRFKHDKAFTPPPPLSFGAYVSTLWKGFLNVQFVVYLLLAMFGVFQLDQFDELFYFLLTEQRGLWVVLFTLIALCLWSGMVYVSSKILLFIQPNFFEGVDPDKVDSTARALDKIGAELRLLRNTPLWLSHVPFLLLFLTLALNFGRLASVEQKTPDFAFKYVSILLALSVVYVLFAIVIHRIHYYSDKETRPERRWSFALFKPDSPASDYALLVDRAPYSILYGQGVLVILMLLFLPSATGLILSKGIGLYAIVMIWLTGLAYMGTLLYQFNQLPKYPVLVGLLLAVLAFSRFNDNSDIRQSPVKLNAKTGEPDTTARRPSVEAYYTHWLKTRHAFTDTSTLPVVVIATAGGGIRAAAWTTESLIALNKQIPGFDHHVLAISGVSGGGVGAATYVAVLGGQATVPVSQSLTSFPDSITAHLRSVVTEDLVSPAVASMLFRGGIHNFIPFPLHAIDRNRWLEDAWEQRLLTSTNIPNDGVRGQLTESFLSLWPDSTTLTTDSLNLPALLLNGAVAETGQKIVMSNLDLGNTSDRQNPFYDVADLFASTGHDVPYKTATFLCARFPFVTSGGKAKGVLPNITTDVRQTSYHIIDGGYAENTGIVTAVQLIKKLQRISESLSKPAAGRATLRRPVAYYLLFLPNYAASEAKGSVNTFRFLVEPVKGFLNTWDRNGVSLDQLIGRTLQGDRRALSFDYASLMLNTKKHRYPLGWYISPTAVGKMAGQAQVDVGRQLADSTSIFRQLKRQIHP
ncbi:hypothetical protein [Fibrella forsythiae]|uniref:PNPLA domain-containing protein n=1 Tax=Fibrella forsythiae TaxID=2817061 RepID=A0ABS3JTD8_9BACT|nr:hypothetical protein [Fibrella forsythiae]MBO0952157.1 hypothetical protein [Fibrella forsythiae]